MVSKTLLRQVISIFFWVMLFLFLCMYMAYISVILVWCVLGAVLNPEKFLPLAAGAVVVVVVIFQVYSKLKQIDDTLKEVVDLSVTDELRASIFDTIQKQNTDLSKALFEAGNAPQVLFHKAINVFMTNKGHSIVDRSITDEILQGNASAIASMLHKNLGIDYTLGLAIVGLLKEDPVVIIDSVYKLSTQLGLDPELNVSLAEVILDTYNPGEMKSKKVQGSVILAIKKLFKQLFPDFPSEILDIILQILFENDPQPLLKLCSSLGVPPQLIKLAVALVANNEGKIQDRLTGITKLVFEADQADVILALQDIAKGNMYENFSRISKIF